MTLCAWAHALTPGEVIESAARFPGLGLVLYGNNYSAAPHLAVPPIAFVNSEAQARQAVAIGPWAAAIVLDERNHTGPSGHYLTPEAYWGEYRRVAAPLEDAGIPVHTMGLAPTFNWWQSLTWSGRFDDEYHRLLPPADGRAFNPNKVRLAEVNRVLHQHEGPWVLSPAPFRGWFDRLMQPVNVDQWAAISQRVDVTAVALWCLREAEGQPQHGLIDRRGNVTSVGRAVQRALSIGGAS